MHHIYRMHLYYKCIYSYDASIYCYRCIVECIYFIEYIVCITAIVQMVDASIGTMHLYIAIDASILQIHCAHNSYHIDAFYRYDALQLRCIQCYNASIAIYILLQIHSTMYLPQMYHVYNSYSIDVIYRYDASIECIYAIDASIDISIDTMYLQNTSILWMLLQIHIQLRCIYISLQVHRRMHLYYRCV